MNCTQVSLVVGPSAGPSASPSAGPSAGPIKAAAAPSSSVLLEISNRKAQDGSDSESSTDFLASCPMEPSATKAIPSQRLLQPLLPPSYWRSATGRLTMIPIQNPPQISWPAARWSQAPPKPSPVKDVAAPSSSVLLEISNRKAHDDSDSESSADFLASCSMEPSATKAIPSQRLLQPLLPPSYWRSTTGRIIMAPR
eukprot:gene24541-10148_t